MLPTSNCLRINKLRPLLQIIVPLSKILTTTHLAEIRSIYKDAQSQLAQERLAVTPPENQNVYSPGDFVLYKIPYRPAKLTAQFLGPYEVLDQHKNDVTCKHLATHTTKIFHTDHIHIFIGTKEAAMEAALRDFDQHVIHRIITFTGARSLQAHHDFFPS